MNARHSIGHPNIAQDLVFPFERPYFEGKCRNAALVFARRGAMVLFAVERTREFGVGFLDECGAVLQPEHFPTLEMAANVFLSASPVAN
jgi:hypothetical protein